MQTLKSSPTSRYYLQTFLKHFYGFDLRENNISLREKCPNTEIFLVLIFPYSDGIWKDTPYSVRISPYDFKIIARSKAAERTTLRRHLKPDPVKYI